MGDHWAVEITPGDLYAKLIDMERRIATAAGGVERLEMALQALSAADADREARIRALEGSRWPLAQLGALVGVAGVVSGIVAIIAGSVT